MQRPRREGGGGIGLGRRGPRAAAPARRGSLGAAGPRAGMGAGPRALELVPVARCARGGGGDPDSRGEGGGALFLPESVALPLVRALLRRQPGGDRPGGARDRARGPRVGEAMISPVRQDGWGAGKPPEAASREASHGLAGTLPPLVSGEETPAPIGSV